MLGVEVEVSCLLLIRMRNPRARLTVIRATETLPNLHEIETWHDFVDALHVLDDHCHQQRLGWDILGDTHSYLHTISAGREVALRPHWENFTQHDRNVLLGLGGGDGLWGLLGNMRRAYLAVSAFTPPVNHNTFNHVLEAIASVTGNVERNFAEAAQNAVNEIMRLHGFGPGVATRILTLARPDCLVSVNAASKDGLGEFAEMNPTTTYLTHHYADLLTALYRQPWFCNPAPANDLEHRLCCCRAALVDAFVYIPDL